VRIPGFGDELFLPHPKQLRAEKVQALRCLRLRAPIAIIFFCAGARANLLFYQDGQGEAYGINDVKMMFAYAGDKFSWFLDRNFTIWRQRSQVLRSLFVFGGPLPGFNSTEGLELELQREILFKWLMPLASDWQNSSDGALRIMYHGTRVTDAEVDEVIKFGSLTM
jgi:hypothetical protein